MKNARIVLYLAAVVALALAACQPQTVIVEREVKVTEIVTQVVTEKVQETVVVAGTPQVVEREVTKVVETVVTATPEPTQIATGGTVIESSFADAEILNPILSTDESSADLEQLLYNELVTIDPGDLSPLPELAERWEVSDDSLVFTFYLRQDVTWHDGEPFTARDVKFTYDTILNSDVNSPRRADLADILTPEQIEVVDDFTIRFTLSQVDASFLTTKTIYGIIPAHLLGDLTAEELNTADFNTKSPVGTGPFMFREWIKDDHVALVKNPNYFGSAPNIDFYYYKIVENQTVEYAQLQTGEVDYAEVTAALWEDAQQQENLACITFPQFGFTFYTYQMDPEKSPLFLDVRTRQALLLALDRQAMVDSIVLGLADVAHSTVPPISWAHNPDNEPRYGYDPERAKELLDEAGWRDEDGDGVREAHGVQGVEDGTPFSFEIHTNAGNNERESNMVVMQQYWNEIGVDAQPTAIEWNALLAELTETYDYELIVVGFGWDTDPDQKTMWHTDSYGSGFNMNRYSNPALDEIIDAALLTVDQEERTELYYEMQHILAEDVPAPILYFRQGTGCWNTRLHEFEYNDIDYKFNAQEWWVER
ncbi:MAG: peptide-binding protein [Anaerolineae bacterium]|nr:peptide-binding protein [Anaerolineae bacterium]